ncbi:UGSC family (seleno)protein [Chloroflexota bacterium]
MRVSAAAEKAGFPTATIVCSGFAVQGSATAAGLGVPGLPMAAYPGHVNFHTIGDLQKNVETVLVDQIVKALTVQPEEAKLPSEPGPRDIVFKGTFEDVNKFFYSREWSDSLPIVPPTNKKVEAFLKFVDRPPDEVIGVLLPDKRAATAWNIAVNGVMAGCRPEYMPVLVAIVEAMANPRFGQEHLGHTPGTEVLITINGKIIKDLGFNYGQGALRDGFQANTTIGRFWRLYFRNVAGFLPHKTDKATFGGTWRVVLPEDEDTITQLGWELMSVDQGFKAGDNVVTLSSCTSVDSMFTFATPSVEEILDKLAARIVDIQLLAFKITFLGPGVRPLVLLSPCIAEAIARGGYSKQDVRQYLYEHATFSAKRYEHLSQDTYGFGSLCDAVACGKLPKRYCESPNSDRFVPIVWSPDDFIIIVSGDPAKDNCLVCAQNGYIGYPVSREISLPVNWEELLKHTEDE